MRTSLNYVELSWARFHIPPDTFSVISETVSQLQYIKKKLLPTYFISERAERLIILQERARDEQWENRPILQGWHMIWYDVAFVCVCIEAGNWSHASASSKQCQPCNSSTWSRMRGMWCAVFMYYSPGICRYFCSACVFSACLKWIYCKMEVVGVESSSLQVDSQPRLLDFVWGFATTWCCSVFIRWARWHVVCWGTLTFKALQTCLLYTSPSPRD